MRGGPAAAPANGAAAPAPAPADPAAADQLVALLRGLGACVSLLQERRHELLLKELLDIQLWQVPQVGPRQRLIPRWRSRLTACLA